MGQGAESAGGYESEYCPYEDGLVNGRWYQKTGGFIHVSKMSKRHLQNTIALCERTKVAANFSCDADLWQDWIDLLSDELENRPVTASKPKQSSTIIRGHKEGMKCHCGTEYKARTADLKRGWGLSCSKRCAAIRRDFGRPAATKLSNKVTL